MDRNCAQLLMLFSHGHKLRETVGIDFKRAKIEQKRREIAKKKMGVDFKRTDQLCHCFLWKRAQRRSGCFISFPVFRGHRTNAVIEPAHKYNTHAGQIQYKMHWIGRVHKG